MSLPKGFKRLEYIQSGGTQYVDTLLKPNQDTRVVMDLQILESHSGEGHLCSARSTSGGPFWILYYNNSKYTTRYGTQAGVSFSLTDRNRHIFDKNKNVTKIDSIAIEGNYETFSVNANIPLLCRLTGTTTDAFLSANLYSCQIYDNDTLVRDYIPCQNASGAVGLWDAVNEEFYGNAGTGTFAAGPVVPEAVDESEITELEYIQSSGVQYVDTLFKPNQDTRVVIDGYNDSASSGWTYGTWESATVNQFAGSCNKSYAVRYGTTNATLTENIPVGPVNFDQNKNAYNVNGTTGFFTAQTFSCQYSIFLFAINAAGAVSSGKFTGKIYSCQIYDNGLLERDYIPAMLSNGEVGLYDRVFHGFYRNAGTGEFIAGPEAATTPKAPVDFRVEAETDTLVTLAWDASGDALGYRLYRSGQLLADTTETSVSVTVEPFAGAVFTLTAYNENGEGAAAELTYFNAPEDPILFLITDRTQADVTERNPKGYYAASDLNRVGYAVEYLAGRLRASGVTVTVSPVLTWTDADWATPGTMQNYLADVQTMRGALKLAESTFAVPADMEKLTYTEANQIEMILLALDAHIKNMLMTLDAGWALGLAYTGLYAKEAY